MKFRFDGSRQSTDRRVSKRPKVRGATRAMESNDKRRGHWWRARDIVPVKEQQA